MPSNKIGGLRRGRGVRRIRAQRLGAWRDEHARANFEIGAELESGPSKPDRPSRSSRWSGANR